MAGNPFVSYNPAARVVTSESARRARRQADAIAAVRERVICINRPFDPDLAIYCFCVGCQAILRARVA